MSTPRSSQRGFVLLAMVSAVLIAVAVTLSIRLLDAATAKSGQSMELDRRMQTIKDALVQYVLVQGHLPCPADGRILHGGPNDGREWRNGPAGPCQLQNFGVVPWVDLGVSPEMSLDSWGRRITYRALPVMTAVSPKACNPACPLTGGWTVQRTPTISVSDVAFVLVSHGVSGLGARLPQGGQMMPLPTSSAEQGNYSASGPFYDIPKSDPSVASTAATHFDDVVHYMTLDALATAAGRK